jgi:hypothetical protein
MSQLPPFSRPGTVRAPSPAMRSHSADPGSTLPRHAPRASGRHAAAKYTEVYRQICLGSCVRCAPSWLTLTVLGKTVTGSCRQAATARATHPQKDLGRFMTTQSLNIRSRLCTACPDRPVPNRPVPDRPVPNRTAATTHPVVVCAALPQAWCPRAPPAPGPPRGCSRCPAAPGWERCQSNLQRRACMTNASFMHELRMVFSTACASTPPTIQH